MSSIWTDESIDALRVGFKEGKSAEIIGEELTAEFKKEFTRNAVVGKIFRLKMGKKKPPIFFKTNSRSRPVSQSNKSGYKSQTPVNGTRHESDNIIELFKSPVIDIEKTPPLMVCIDELDQADISAGGRCRMCRYPSGNPKDPGGLLYCGLPTGGKSSWCSYHRQFTVVASTSRVR